MAGGATVMVLYPRSTSDSTFNKSYYLSTHMPLCEKVWKKHGLKSYIVSELNADGPYVMTVVMQWESQEAFGKAVQDPGTKELMDDLVNYYTEKPVLVHGPVLGSG